MANFYERVYAIARQIPPGQVTTYGMIAALAGQPLGARAVGYALRALPVDSDVPWHRVINKQGKLSPRGDHDRCEPDRQRGRLEAEGVVFDSEDRVSFKLFGWEGPP